MKLTIEIPDDLADLLKQWQTGYDAPASQLIQAALNAFSELPEDAREDAVALAAAAKKARMSRTGWILLFWSRFARHFNLADPYEGNANKVYAPRTYLGAQLTFLLPRDPESDDEEFMLNISPIVNTEETQLAVSNYRVPRAMPATTAAKHFSEIFVGTLRSLGVELSDDDFALLRNARTLEN